MLDGQVPETQLFHVCVAFIAHCRQQRTHTHRRPLCSIAVWEKQGDLQQREREKERERERERETDLLKGSHME